MESKLKKRPLGVPPVSQAPPTEVNHVGRDSLSRDCLLIGSPTGWQLAGYGRSAILGAVVLGLAIVLGPLVTWFLTK